VHYLKLDEQLENCLTKLTIPGMENFQVRPLVIPH